MDSLQMKPEEIERESFRIIDAEAGEHGWPADEWQIVRRIVHTSADFDYVKSLVMSDDFARRGCEALRAGYGIVTDTRMALSGISRVRISHFGNRVACHVADDDVAGEARKLGITRSVAAMRKAVRDEYNRIFVIGNAPTALFELLRLIRAGEAVPALVVGLPVGFVGAVESHEALASAGLDIPFITNIGRKGGSNVAAAVINALAVLAAP